MGPSQQATASWTNFGDLVRYFSDARVLSGAFRNPFDYVHPNEAAAPGLVPRTDGMSDPATYAAYIAQIKDPPVPTEQE